MSKFFSLTGLAAAAVIGTGSAVLGTAPAHAVSAGARCVTPSNFAITGQSCQELDIYNAGPAEDLYIGGFNDSTFNARGWLRRIQLSTQYLNAVSGGVQFYDASTFDPSDPTTYGPSEIATSGLKVTSLAYRVNNPTTNPLTNTAPPNAWIPLTITAGGVDIKSNSANTLWTGAIPIGVTAADALQFKFTLNNIDPNNVAYAATADGQADGAFANTLFFVTRTNTALSSIGGGNSIYRSIQLDTQLVPAPLPIAGLAAAFGFSRRLRRRIASAQPV